MCWKTINRTADFQQDWAKARTAKEQQAFLQDFFGDRVDGRGL